MIGNLFVCALAVGLIVTYMTIVHSFLHSSEEAQDEEREANYRDSREPVSVPISPSGRQFAH